MLGLKEGGVWSAVSEHAKTLCFSGRYFETH